MPTKPIIPTRQPKRVMDALGLGTSGIKIDSPGAVDTSKMGTVGTPFAPKPTVPPPNVPIAEKPVATAPVATDPFKTGNAATNPFTPTTTATPTPTTTPTATTDSSNEQAKALKGLQDQYLNNFNKTEDEKNAERALADIASKQALVSSSEELGLNKIQNTPIEMGLIMGEQANLQRGALAQQNALKAQATPLTAQLAQAQAQRVNQQTRMEKEIGLKTPTTKEVGNSLVELDPSTGRYKMVYQSPVEAKNTTLGEGQVLVNDKGEIIARGPDKSPTSDTTADYKNWTLAGSPGTFAQWLTNTKQRQPTANQTSAAGYAMRMQSSGDIIDKITAENSPAAGWGGAIQTAIPSNVLTNWAKTSAYQQLEQAQRDFVNAVLRRESGAVINPSEFINAQKQYFPMPGDSAKVLEQKKANRDMTLKGVVSSAGSALSEDFMVGASETISSELEQSRQYFPPGTSDEVISAKLKDPQFRQTLGFPNDPGTSLNSPLQTANIGGKQVTATNDILDRVKAADAELYAATGTHLAVNQSYRTGKEQEMLYNKLHPTGAQVAPPGQSFHEKGGAIDVTNWQVAEPYLRKYGLINGLAEDKGHFSIGEFS
jgi:hypothetical protein